MNKKILLSVAAAATIATTFTGCGSSDSTTATGTTGSTALGTTDGYINNATMTCENGTVSYVDDTNLTFLISSDNPGKCTITGGKLSNGKDAHANYTVNVPSSSDREDNNITSPFANPIGDQVQSSVTHNGNTLAEAKLAVLTKMGVTVTADSNLDELMMADTSSEASLANFPAFVAAGTTALKKQVVTLHTNKKLMMDAGLTAAEASKVLAKATDFTPAALQTSMTDNSDMNTTQINSIKTLNDQIDALVNFNDEADILDALMDQNISTVVTEGDFNDTRDANIEATQANIEAFYIDANQSKQLDTNISDTLTFSLKDQNLTTAANGAFTGAISFSFQNEGNANYSFQTVLKNIALTEPGTADGNYTFTIGNNQNATFAGKNFQGGIELADTKDLNDTHSLSGVEALTGAIASNGDINVSKVFQWTNALLMDSTNGNASLATNYGVNGNWSTTVILSIDNNDTSAQTIYKKQSNNNLAPADISTITVDEARTGAILFNGPIFE